MRLRLNVSLTLPDARTGRAACKSCKHVVTFERAELARLMGTSCPECKKAYLEWPDGSGAVPESALGVIAHEVKVDLTREQREIIKDIAEAMREDAFSTTPAVREEVSALIETAYAAEKLSKPQIIFCASPDDYVRAARAYGPEGLAAFPTQHREVTPENAMSVAFSMIGNAQPKHWPSMGREVDFDYGMDALRDDRSGFDPLWRAVIRAFEKPTLALSDLKNAVEHAQTRSVTDPDAHWLVYSGTSLAIIADNLALAESLGRMGEMPFDAQRFTTVRRLYGACWSVHPFTRVCFVCERPESVFHPGPDRRAPDRTVRIRFRDGAEYSLDLAQF